MKMSIFWLDIRWWIFGVITIGQFSDCAKHQNTFVNENSDRNVQPVIDDDDDRTPEIGCPLKCLCLGELADCSKNNLEKIPSIPTWAKAL